MLGDEPAVPFLWGRSEDDAERCARAVETMTSASDQVVRRVVLPQLVLESTLVGVLVDQCQLDTDRRRERAHQVGVQGGRQDGVVRAAGGEPALGRER